MASLFIVFEGPNGVGETVLIEAVGAAIEERLIPVLRTKEPTGSGLGIFIRNIEEV